MSQCHSVTMSQCHSVTVSQCHCANVVFLEHLFDTTFKNMLAGCSPDKHKKQLIKKTIGWVPNSVLKVWDSVDLRNKRGTLLSRDIVCLYPPSPPPRILFSIRSTVSCRLNAVFESLLVPQILERRQMCDAI